MNDLQKKSMNTLKDLLEKSKNNISAVLPRHLTTDRLLKIATFAALRNPKLLDCSKESILQCVMLCAELGLEPNTPMSHAYIIPYGKEATFQLGYQGMIELARRSGEIQTLFAAVVHEKDKFKFQLGSDPKIDHEPCLDSEPGKPLAVYAIAKLKDGATQMEVMTIAEVEKIKARSKTANNGPWKTDYEEMARKTVVKRLCKYLPKSMELAKAITADTNAEVEGKAPEFDLEIIGEQVETDPLTEAMQGKKDEPKPELQPVTPCKVCGFNNCQCEDRN